MVKSRRRASCSGVPNSICGAHEGMFCIGGAGLGAPCYVIVNRGGKLCTSWIDSGGREEGRAGTSREL